MISSIVYFSEIVEEIKDATGIENARPLYDRFKRFVFKTERDIGGGGTIIRKKKSFTKGDGLYDGQVIIMPDDFVGEFSYGSLSIGNLVGNRLYLYCKGPDKIDLRYMGFVLDEEGNPFTTRNHLDAIVSYAVYRLYSQKVFLKDGNLNFYKELQRQYEDNVLNARGQDAFPSEEEWLRIGKTLHGGVFEALTDCGMKGFKTGCLDPMYVEEPISNAICIYTAFISGVSNATSSTSAELLRWEKGFINGISNGTSSASATLHQFSNPEMALNGISNGSANSTSGTLISNVPIINCNQSFNKSGGAGTFTFQIDFGTAIGLCGIDYSAYSVPDRFRLEWNGQEVANSKFVGFSGFNNDLLNLGYTQEEINTGGNGDGELRFFKPASSPSVATIYVDAPLGGTAWSINGVCPITASGGSSQVNGTLTSI